VTIEDVIAEGELKGIVIWRIANGRICERWATFDHLEIRPQLGAA
jgi:predicted ester cyclase